MVSFVRTKISDPTTFHIKNSEEWGTDVFVKEGDYLCLALPFSEAGTNLVAELIATALILTVTTPELPEDPDQFTFLASEEEQLALESVAEVARNDLRDVDVGKIINVFDNSFNNPTSFIHIVLKDTGWKITSCGPHFAFQFAVENIVKKAPLACSAATS